MIDVQIMLLFEKLTLAVYLKSIFYCLWFICYV